MTHRSKRNPLTRTPLRVPGQSLQELMLDLAFVQVLPYLTMAMVLTMLAAKEWIAYWTDSPRTPKLFTTLAALAIGFAAWRVVTVKRKLDRLRLGRDGERAVGQHLSAVGVEGARLFHDIPGDDFNLDHVVLSTRGFFVIETKTRSKPRKGEARVRLTESGLVLSNYAPDSVPLRQAQSGAKWLQKLLRESTGSRYPVKAIVVFPGWFVEPMSAAWKDAADRPWVLNPEQLAGFIEHEPERLAPRDVVFASKCLAQHIRAAPCQSFTLAQ